MASEYAGERIAVWWKVAKGSYNGIYSPLTMLGSSYRKSAHRYTARETHSLLDTVVEDFMLLRSRGKHAIESEAILLWTRAELCRAHVHGLEIVIEGYYDLSALPLFDGIRWSKSEGIECSGEIGDRLVSWLAYRQTTLIFVDVDIVRRCRYRRRKGMRVVYSWYERGVDRRGIRHA